MIHVISKKKLRQFWAEYPDAQEQLAAWYKNVRKSVWLAWADVQRTYPKASYYKCCLIFNICGGKYRLIVKRAENWKRLWVVGVFIHGAYDKNEWKKYCE